MTCREAERLVMPYINGSITDDELKDFLEHIEHCGECREELEIYFTVDVGIRQLDEETGSYNISGDLETELELSRQRIHTLRLPPTSPEALRILLQTARYAVNTLCFWALLVVIILQVRIWGQTGFMGL